MEDRKLNEDNLVNTLYNPNLHAELKNIAENFRQRSTAGEIRVAEPIFTGGRLLWQRVEYGGLPLKEEGENLNRGYLMVETGDMPKALTALDTIAANRNLQGKPTVFKWLVMTYPALNDFSRKLKFVNDELNIGNYVDLGSEDPRIVIYSDKPEDIQDVLTELANNPEWESIESRRRALFKLFKQEAPLRGTNAFIDAAGKEWRSLSFNFGKGYSEDLTKPNEDIAGK